MPQMFDGHAAFGVLGPLSVCDEAGEHPIRSSYQRVLLAALLLRADRLVPVEELLDFIWEDEPPARPRQALQNHVMRVRQLLGPQLAERLLTLPTGYLFHADDTELDFRRFTESRTLGQAAAAVGDWEGARTHLHAAFLLWRGEPLADIASTRLQSEHCEALRQEHLTARELCIDADLNLENYTQAVTDLRTLTSAHPWRESLQAKLLVALYGAGRQAEALTAFRDFRKSLITEMGVEPGSELQQLHQRVLVQEPVRSLLGRGLDPAPPTVERPAPYQSPSSSPPVPAPSTVQPPERPGDPDTNGDTVPSRRRRARRNRPTLGVYLAVIAAFLAGLAVARPLLGNPDRVISVEDPEPAVVKVAPDGGVKYVGRVGSDQQIMSTSGVEVPVVNEVGAGNLVIVSLGLTSTTDGPVTVTDTAGNTYKKVADVMDVYWHRVMVYAAFNARAMTTVDRVIAHYPQSSKYHIAVDEFSGLSRASSSVTGWNTYEHNQGSFTTSATPLDCAPGDLLLSVIATNSGPAPVLAHGWQTLRPLKLSSYRLTTAFRYVTKSEKCAVTRTNSTAQWAATAVVLHR
jgi:DNA-binding SARP family transcriptional activator